MYSALALHCVLGAAESTVVQAVFARKGGHLSGCIMNCPSLPCKTLAC